MPAPGFPVKDPPERPPQQASYPAAPAGRQNDALLADGACVIAARQRPRAQKVIFLPTTVAMPRSTGVTEPSVSCLAMTEPSAGGLQGLPNVQAGVGLYVDFAAALAPRN